MKRNHLKNFLECSLLFSFLLTSCYIVPTALPTTKPGAAATHAVQTLQAQAPARTQAAQQTADRLTRQAPLPSLTPEPTRPTATPMPTNTIAGPIFSATPTDVTPLPTKSDLPTIIALANTNCRSGPSRLYPVVGYLVAKQEGILLGRNSDNTWWYIVNPDKPDEFCWVWAETTEVSGDIASLQVVIVPTLVPVLDFDLGFAGIKKCGSTEYLIFRITNTGTETLVDAVIEIVNIQTGKTLFGPTSLVIPNMVDAKDCPSGVNTIEGRERGFLAVGRTQALKDDLRLRAIIMMCKDEGLEPMCLTKKVEFRL